MVWSLSPKRPRCQAAGDADRRIREGRGTPLTGVPIVFKDNMCTAGVLTTCSSRMLESFVPPYTATAVQKLLDAGAVMIGKSNMDEFAMGSSTENSAFFPTHNPWRLDHVPGGSSRRLRCRRRRRRNHPRPWLRYGRPPSANPPHSAE